MRKLIVLLLIISATTTAFAGDGSIVRTQGRKIQDRYIVVLDNKAVKCLDEETEAEFIFEGGKLKSEFRNAGSMNCDGIFHIIFKNSAYTPSQLTKLGSKKIIALQIKTSSPKPYVISLSPAQQQNLMNLVACVIKESKTVL